MPILASAAWSAAGWPPSSASAAVNAAIATLAGVSACFSAKVSVGGRFRRRKRGHGILLSVALLAGRHEAVAGMDPVALVAENGRDDGGLVRAQSHAHHLSDNGCVEVG